MTSLERTKRVVASAYATRHGDATARALVTALERENDVLSARIAARACPAPSRTVRYAGGWFVRTSLLCAALLAMLYGVRYAERALLAASDDVTGVVVVHPSGAVVKSIR